MKKDTKDLLKAVALTAAVPNLEKAFVKVDDIKTCLHEATVAEIQNELTKRQTEGSEIKKG
jgi:hypothetical protein